MPDSIMYCKVVFTPYHPIALHNNQTPFDSAPIVVGIQRFMKRGIDRRNEYHLEGHWS